MRSDNITIRATTTQLDAIIAALRLLAVELDAGRVSPPMNWVSHEKQDPATTGWYRVLISGDSEFIEGHQIYAYDEYETWMFITVDEDEPRGSGIHDETFETVLAWYGPFIIPRTFDIVTEYEPHFGWIATDDKTYDGPPCPIGHGATEAEAIADLMEQLEE